MLISAGWCFFRRLEYNNFGPEGAKALAPGLAATASLTKILVGGNRLGNEGTIILCDALRESTVSKVEELNLYYNEIGPDGAKAIAALCAVRASLTEVRQARASHSHFYTHRFIVAPLDR